MVQEKHKCELYLQEDLELADVCSPLVSGDGVHLKTVNHKQETGT